MSTLKVASYSFVNFQKILSFPFPKSVMFWMTGFSTFGVKFKQISGSLEENFLLR